LSAKFFSQRVAIFFKVCTAAVEKGTGGIWQCWGLGPDPQGYGFSCRIRTVPSDLCSDFENLIEKRKKTYFKMIVKIICFGFTAMERKNLKNVKEVIKQEGIGIFCWYFWILGSECEECCYHEEI
jgi:hypothetical protein